MALKYRYKHFHFMALQNLQELGLLVWKYTLWQPCSVAANINGITLKKI
jgi:hypothetical protein